MVTSTKLTRTIRRLRKGVPARWAAPVFFAAALVALYGLLNDVPGRAAENVIDAAQQAIQRRLSSSNMKQMMIGMLNYHDAQKKFPPAFSNADGKPLLSWRVTLLPYLEGKEAKDVWEQFHLDEPWDSEHNKPLVAKMPKVFQSPASKLNDGRTVYLTVRGDETAYPGEQAISMRQLTDGTSNTISIVETDDSVAVPWTKPDDFKLNIEHPRAGLGGLYSGGFNAAMCDGSVHFLTDKVSDKGLNALFTRAGGEAEPPF